MNNKATLFYNMSAFYCKNLYWTKPWYCQKTALDLLWSSIPTSSSVADEPINKHVIYKLRGR